MRKLCNQLFSRFDELKIRIRSEVFAKQNESIVVIGSESAKIVINVKLLNEYEPKTFKLSLNEIDLRLGHK